MSFNSIRKIFLFKHFASDSLTSLWDNRSACAMDILWDELRSNNVEIDKETLSFHIHACLKDYEGICETVFHRMDKVLRRTNPFQMLPG